MVAAVYFAYCVCFCLAWRVCYVRAGGRMRFHVNNQGRVLPCRAKHACRFGASFENGGGRRKPFLTDTMRLWAWSRVSLAICRRLA